VILATAENLPLTAGARTAAVVSMVFFFPGSGNTDKRSHR